MSHTELSDYAEREVAQFEAHRRIWSAKNPPPPKPNLKTGDIWLMFMGLSILNLAAMIVSAPHTIPLFLESVADQEIFGTGINIRHVVGGAAFFMIEIALILLTYIRIRQRSRSREEWQEGVEGSNKWIRLALYMVLTVALCANIYSTLNPSFKETLNPLDGSNPDSIAQLRTASTKPDTISDQDNLEKVADFVMGSMRLLIFLLIGASAPILLFFTGEASAIIWVQRSATFKAEMAEYDRKYGDWNQMCIAAYRPSKLRGVSTSVHSPSTEKRLLDDNRQSSRQNNRQDNGRRMDAGEIILAHLADHAEDVNLSVNELADKVNLPRSTVGKYLKQVRPSKIQ